MAVDLLHQVQCDRNDDQQTGTTIKTGDKVKIEYTGTLDDGTIFDSSAEHGNPLEFQVGGGQVIKGFDDAVLGMKENEEKQFKNPKRVSAR